MILEAEKQGTSGLANDIVRHDIPVLPWDILNVGQDWVPLLHDSEKTSIFSYPKSSREGCTPHTPVAC